MSERSPEIHRRTWLVGVCGAALGVRPVLGRAQAREDVLEQIRAKARLARMQPFEASETAHFVGIGDAPGRQRQDALGVCEAFAADYFGHFRAKGFTIDWPAAKLPVVVLAGPESYAAFEQEFPDQAIGGHFDLDANWLVTFDYGSKIRQLGPAQAEEARQNNTLTLVHETFHQLSYNTGLLDRADDIPKCVTEGLATYAETWRPAHRAAIGAINVRRRRGLEAAQRDGVRWVPLPTLLVSDPLFDDARTEQLAYAASSLLAARMMRDPARLPRWRDYLKALRPATSPSERVALATTHLGDLDKLDRDIRR